MNLELVSVQVCVPVLAAFALVLTGRSGAKPRLDSLEPVMESRPEPVGAAVLIASLIALVRNGSDLVEAFEELAGRRFATREVTYDRVHAMLLDCSPPAERGEGMDIIAAALAASYRLSAESGCRASDCLQAVASLQKRQAALDDARDGAFAMPRATVRLLSGLPILTVFLGELLGAHPLAFLFRWGTGLVCLATGTCFYCAGLIWMWVLLKGMGKKGGL